MKAPNLESLIVVAMSPRKFISSYGESYDGYYISVPGDICKRCGFTATGHYLAQIHGNNDRLLPSGRSMYLECADETA